MPGLFWNGVKLALNSRFSASTHSAGVCGVEWGTGGREDWDLETGAG